MHNPATTTASATRTPRWPIVLWLLQLVVPGLGLGFGLMRFVTDPPLTSKLLAGVAVCAAWVILASVPLLFGRFRRGLVAKRTQLALCFGSTLFAVVACDLALTLTGIVPTIAAQRERSLEYRPTAFTRHRLLSKNLDLDGMSRMKINSRGYLGPEIVMPKPPGVNRLVFLGGSQVYGGYWSGGKDWPATVGEVLGKDGYRVDVINAGIPNHQTGDAIGKLFADLWLTEPDVVVLCNTWNDIKYFAELTPDRPYLHVAAPTAGIDRRLHPVGVDRLLCLSAFYRKIYGNLITALMGVGDEGERIREPVLKTTKVSLDQYRLNLQTFCDVGRNIGAKVVFCKQARLPVPDLSEKERQRVPYNYTGLDHDELIRAFAACDRIIDEVAAEKGCKVIDMTGPLSGRPELFADHIHFSLEGSLQAAKLVAKQLEPLLK